MLDNAIRALSNENNEHLFVCIVYLPSTQFVASVFPTDLHKTFTEHRRFLTKLDFSSIFVTITNKSPLTCTYRVSTTPNPNTHKPTFIESMMNILERIVYSPPKSDYASHVQKLPEVILKPKTTSATASSFTDHISMPSMPSMSMPHISMPTFSAPSISIPKLSLPSFPELTLSSLKENLTSSPVLPIILILLTLSLIAYILHTYLIKPHKPPRNVAFDVTDPRSPYDERTGPPLLRTVDLMERCRAQARRDYALGRLSVQPSQVQQWRAGLVAQPSYQPVEAQRVVDVPAPRPWVPARVLTPFALPFLTETSAPMTPVQENHSIVPVRMERPVPMTPVQEDHQLTVRTPSPALVGGFVARMVEVVSLRRSTRAKRAPERFHKVEFPKGRRI